MAVEEFVPSDARISDLLVAHAEDARARGLTVHCELDGRCHIRRDAVADRLLERLLRFVFATIPDGCEVFVATARLDSPVATLGSGVLTLRWQVVGAEPPPHPDDVAPIRPIPGGAAFHARSEVVRDLQRTCAKRGWHLALSATREDGELWARLRMA